MKGLVFLLLFAFPTLAQDDALLQRVRPIAGKFASCAAVYSRYASGRPRLVVAGTDLGHFDTAGELLLIRLPDAKGGRGKVVDRLETEAGVMELAFVHLVDPKDIAATLHIVHPPQGITVHVAGQQLIQIVDSLPDQVVDLDGDGIPEIITGFPGGEGRCGARGNPIVLGWNGKAYDDEDKRYAAIAAAKAGQPAESAEFEAPVLGDGKPHQYVVHVYRGRGVKEAHVRVDDEAVTPEMPFELESDCHTWTFELSGVAGAGGWALIEERP